MVATEQISTLLIVPWLCVCFWGITQNALNKHLKHDLEWEVKKILNYIQLNGVSSGSANKFISGLLMSLVWNVLEEFRLKLKDCLAQVTNKPHISKFLSSSAAVAVG